MNGGLNVVIGASGGVGSAVTRLLAGDSVNVRAANRSGSFDAPAAVETVATDALDAETVRQTCAGAATVFHCAHPEEDYSQFVPMTENIVAGAEAAGAKLIMAASAYPYGKVDGPMTEDMPYHPEAPSGEYHARGAEIVMEAHEAGRVRAAIGRASNYFGPNAGRTWPGIDFEDARKGETAQVIGDVDEPHTYTYVDDFANALITLAENEQALGQVWHVPGAETLTTRQFLEMVYSEANHELNIRAGSRFILTVMGWFNSDIVPALEVLYQFERPFILDDTKYRTAFGGEATPSEVAIRRTLGWFQDRDEAAARA